MALTKNSRKNAPSAQESVLNTRIRRSVAQKDVSFITEAHIPAGRYKTTVVGVYEAINSKGKEALDIVYSFVDEAGTRRQAKERLNMDSFTLEALIEHWLDVGQLDETSTYSDITGIAENVTVVYKRPGSLGSLQERKPRKGIIFSRKATKSAASKATDIIVEDLVDDDDILPLDEDEEDLLPLDDDDYLVEEDDA